MWWEPRSERERSLAIAVQQLQSWFREQGLNDVPIAWGVGSAWSPIDERLVPLVLLNSDLFKNPTEHIAYPIPLDLYREELGQQSRLPRIPGSQRLHFMIVGRPRPSLAVEDLLGKFLAFTDPIICKQTGMLGTAAVRVWDDNVGEYGLLTAGHVFPKGLNSPVERRRRRLWLLSQREEIGYVSHHVSPQGPAPQWDAAVIRLSKPAARASPVVNTLEYFRQPEMVLAHGAISGVVKEAAVLQGALVEGGAADTRWMNCWMVAPAGVLTSGDSGTAVFTRKGVYLGLYVGSSFLEGSETVLVHYVQDACSLEKHVMRQWQVSFR